MVLPGQEQVRPPLRRGEEAEIKGVLVPEEGAVFPAGGQGEDRDGPAAAGHPAFKEQVVELLRLLIAPVHLVKAAVRVQGKQYVVERHGSSLLIGDGRFVPV